VARRAVDVEALLAAIEHLGGQRERQRVGAAAPFFPVKNAASSCSVPRATVPSTSGRALDAFLKNTLSRSGIAFGELCMSCRQPRRQQHGGRKHGASAPDRLAADLAYGSTSLTSLG
jgi:hypothetical protein